ncbi:MAG: hypothetical protein WCB51_11610 [Candidatus Dormiibacterota bacterium]
MESERCLGYSLAFGGCIEHPADPIMQIAKSLPGAWDESPSHLRRCSLTLKYDAKESPVLERESPKDGDCRADKVSCRIIGPGQLRDTRSEHAEGTDGEGNDEPVPRPEEAVNGACRGPRLLRDTP